jgi:plastocyanin
VVPFRGRRRPPTRLVAAAASLAAVLCLSAQAGQAAGVQTGASLKGVVRIVAKPSRRLASAGAYPGRTVTVGVEHDASELANVVVFVKAGATPTAPGRVAIRQVDEEFVPHLVAITVGSTVDFPNDDLLFHNVFSLSRANTFDLGRYPRGQSKSRTFQRPGLVKVYCHLHSHMSALVRVFDHPYFAIPDTNGEFTIGGLTAGRHEVVAWHERVGEVTETVVVEAGQQAAVSFSLPFTDDRE